ncbi:dTDP-4-dehydrorhamnose 3,5-epimerase family protein, partial [Rhizobium ruizarguesonis]
MHTLNVEQLAIEGVKKVTPARFGDSRGYFSEVFKDSWFRSNVADVSFVQDNESLSAQPGTVRGLHFQLSPFAQGKLVRCLRGALLDVSPLVAPA